LNKKVKLKDKSIVDENFNLVGKMIDQYKIKDSGTRRDFGTGAVRDCSSGKGRFDLLPPTVLRALAIHFEKGCEKYGERNYLNGIPIHSFLDSAMRHLMMVMDGKDDENHLISSIWNLVCAYETILLIQEDKLPKELYDIPRKITLPDPYNIFVKKKENI
jgi:hypothetical protein